MFRDDFAVFILSHGRPNNVKTIKTLENSNYKGKYYIIVDNEDKTIEQYKENFGDKVIVFNKQEISDDKRFDKFDNNNNKKVIYFARNACFDIAKELGLKYFIQFDDDYTSFQFRYEEGDKLKHLKMNNIGEVFNLMIDFLNSSPKILTICFSQGGDFIGGRDSGVWKKQLVRKAMNSFLCSTDKVFNFKGRINEDVNTYTLLGNQGELFFTIANLSLEQTPTQSNEGGMTDIYLDSGTYVKSFYSIICSPQAVKIALMGNRFMRMHHKVDWKYCSPKILDEKYKK